MKSKLLIFVALFLVSLNLVVVMAAVGLGISPSKMVEQIPAGETTSYEFLVFNTGDSPIEVSFIVKGDFVDFTEFSRETLVLEPEPKPHELPIKNGETVIVSFSPPASSKSNEYVGTIAIVGSPSAGSTFGGSVGVSTQVTLKTIPTKSIFSYITTKHLIYFGILVVLIVIFFLLKRAGMKIEFKKKKK